MAVFLAVLWTVIGVHCQIEWLPGMDFLRCDSQQQPAVPASDSHCGGDMCSAIEQGMYQTTQDIVLQPAPVPSVLFVLPPWPEVLVEQCQADILDSIAAPFPKPWQFHSRTALLARAPSFVS